MTTTDRHLSRPAYRGLAPRAGLAVAAAAAISLTACSSPARPGASAAASSSPSATATGPMLGAIFKGTIYVSTPTSHETKPFVYRVANVQNCSAAALSGWDGTFRVPTAQAPDPQAQIEVAGFHGPGTYPPAVLSHDKADAIVLTGKSGTSQYDITTPGAHGTPGKEVLFLQKDGSGQLVYSGAHLDGNASSPEVAGLISWSCTS